MEQIVAWIWLDHSLWLAIMSDANVKIVKGVPRASPFGAYEQTKKISNSLSVLSGLRTSPDKRCFKETKETRWPPRITCAKTVWHGQNWQTPSFALTNFECPTHSEIGSWEWWGPADLPSRPLLSWLFFWFFMRVGQRDLHLLLSGCCWTLCMSPWRVTWLIFTKWNLQGTRASSVSFRELNPKRFASQSFADDKVTTGSFQQKSAKIWHVQNVHLWQRF